MSGKDDREAGLPRLSQTEALILGLLMGKSELYGLEMVEQSGGRLKRGTIYVTLGRMQDKGLVESRKLFPAHTHRMNERFSVEEENQKAELIVSYSNHPQTVI